jgi:hypothetical protein
MHFCLYLQLRTHNLFVSPHASTLTPRALLSPLVAAQLHLASKRGHPEVACISIGGLPRR